MGEPRSADMLRQAMTDVPVTSTPIYVPVASIPLAKNPSDRYKSIDSGIDKIMAVLEKDYSEILEAIGRQVNFFIEELIVIKKFLRLISEKIGQQLRWARQTKQYFIRHSYE